MHTAPEFSIDKSLVIESENARWFKLLFLDQLVKDISASVAERKTGTDFLLHTERGWVRIENKFEQYASGNLTLELISVDRPHMVPGWFYTSQTGWLFSWFAPSAELVVLPMQALREVVLKSLLRARSTTTAYNLPKSRKGTGYCSWSVLERIDYLLRAVPGAMWLDTAYELGAPREDPPMLSKHTAQQVDTDTLMERLKNGPLCSTPVQPPELGELAHQMWRFNRRRNDKRTQEMYKLLHH